MTTLLYTTAHEDLDSELVYDVLYDADTREAHVNLQGQFYTYSDVPAHEVDALVNANSVGRAFNGSFMSKGFKQKFGPGQKRYSTTISKRELVVANAPAGTPKDLTYAPNAIVDGKPVSPDAVRVSLGYPQTTASTNRVSLTVADEPVELPKFKHTVHFNSNGARTYALEASSVDEAVEELQKVAAMLGVEAKVTGVFVHLV